MPFNLITKEILNYVKEEKRNLDCINNFQCHYGKSNLRDVWPYDDAFDGPSQLLVPIPLSVPKEAK